MEIMGLVSWAGIIAGQGETMAKKRGANGEVHGITV